MKRTFARSAMAGLAGAVLTVAVAPAADAAPLATIRVENPRLQYHGTATRYGSLKDARAGDAPQATYNIGTRDASLVQTAGSMNIFQTLDDEASDSFIELWDFNAQSQTSQSAKWLGGDYSKLAYHMKGENLVDDPDEDQYASFWEAPDDADSPGTFHQYEMSVLFGFENGAEVVEVGDGFFDSHTANTSATGSFTAIFEHLDTDAPHSFYAIDLTLDYDAHSHELAGDPGEPDYWGDARFTATPTPTAAVAGLVAFGLLALRRPRNARARRIERSEP